MHSDVCGPISTTLMGGALYFVTFIDDFSQEVWAYPLRCKDQVTQVFQRFVTLVEVQTGKKVKCLRSDNGGEYCQNPFRTFVMLKGLRGS